MDFKVGQEVWIKATRFSGWKRMEESGEATETVFVIGRIVGIDPYFATVEHDLPGRPSGAFRSVLPVDMLAKMQLAEW